MDTLPSIRTGPVPLRRLGGYRIEQTAWTNPLPPRGATGEELRAFWLKILRCHADQMSLRDRHCKCGGESLSHIQWKYGQKIEIKVHESVLELLHRIIAPAAPFLCGHDCPHVDLGATPDQLRRFLDSLDARDAQCREEARAAPLGDCRDDQTEEAEIMRDCRRYLEAATGLVFPPSSPPAGWPPPRPRFTHAQFSCDVGGRGASGAHSVAAGRSAAGAVAPHERHSRRGVDQECSATAH